MDILAEGLDGYWIVTRIVAPIVVSTIILSISWLVKAVLTLQKDMVKIQTTVSSVIQNCNRHQKWMIDMSSDVKRMDKNIVKICAKLDVEEDSDK